MERTTFVLVDSAVLPEVFLKVLRAKHLLATGEAKNAADAARMAGVSRSAYYKYKDSVYAYQQADSGQATLSAILQDSPGVLSSVINELYRAGANILAVNQNIPVRNTAAVSISVGTGQMKTPMEELLDSVKSISGVKSIEQIG